MKYYISTGGLGDALICLAKILQIGELGVWHHGTSHDIHMGGVKDIQGLIEGLTCECSIVTRQTYEKFHEDGKIFAQNNNMEYTLVNTKITEMDCPFLPQPLVPPTKMGNVCIQMTAGRINDATKRTVSPDVVKEVLDIPSAPVVVLIGPEQVDCPQHERLQNMTGQTFSILQTFSIIGGSDYFIAQDGVCAYYGAFLGIPGLINYHMPTLTSHYWNKKWKHIQMMFDGNVLLSHGKK